MGIFKLSPGRVSWIVLLCLLGTIAPRLAVNSPIKTSDGEFQNSDRPAPTQSSKFRKTRPGSLNPDEDIFSSESFPRLSIQLSRSETAKLRNYHWEWGGNAGEREDASATVYEGR